eukprot:Awhi_evm1s13468
MKATSSKSLLSLLVSRLATVLTLLSFLLSCYNVFAELIVMQHHHFKLTSDYLDLGHKLFNMYLWAKALYHCLQHLDNLDLSDKIFNVKMASKYSVLSLVSNVFVTIFLKVNSGFLTTNMIFYNSPLSCECFMLVLILGFNVASFIALIVALTVARRELSKHEEEIVKVSLSKNEK